MLVFPDYRLKCLPEQEKGTKIGDNQGVCTQLPVMKTGKDHIRLLLEKASSPIPCIYMGGKENK
jgi:hypothetical protein